MNILIIDNSIAFTGALKCALNEAEILSDKHKFVFVLHNQSNQVKVIKEKGFTVHQLHMIEIKRSIPMLLLYPFMLLRNFILLRKIVHDERIDVVQVNDFYNMLGVMLKKFGYEGQLLTYVRFLPSVMPGILRKMWIKQGLKHSHKVIAVSDAVLKQLPQTDKVVRIYDPVQLSEKLPEKSYETKSHISLLYLSNYIQGKGQEHAIEAFAQAYKKHKNIQLTFIGGDMGMDKNIAYKEDLQAQVEELGLSEVIKFEPFNANVEAVIKEADIVLNFSEAESFSMTCLEAAYYGTALIATRCGGPEEIIENGKTGITVPLKDTNAMADAISKLVTDDVLRTQYAKAGREYVIKKFNIEQYKQQIEEVLTNI